VHALLARLWRRLTDGEPPPDITPLLEATAAETARAARLVTALNGQRRDRARNDFPLVRSFRPDDDDDA